VSNRPQDVRSLACTLQLFGSGVLIMDEVDLLLHPLKAERWTCAIHCLDAVFYLERRSMSVPFHQSGRAHRILQELHSVIEEGYGQRALQRSPQ
jgi:hypothetical protein